MMKRIICFLWALIICFGMNRIECSAAVINPEHSCSLTLFYTQGGAPFSDLQVDIYRIAELSENGQYKMLEPYSDYPVNIYGITSQQEWQETSQTIKNYVIANQVEAYQSRNTDAEGTVFFDHLETGLYMVKGVTAHNNNGVFIFQDFMVYLPTPVENDYDYDVEARPKCTQYTSPADYTVLKLWKDSNSEQRPVSVCIEILKDGVVRESVVLDRSNNWSYSWEVSEKDGVWSVIEKEVPEGYQVAITKNEGIFIVTNTKKPSVPHEPEKPDDPKPTETPDKPLPEIPSTGDTSPLLLYAILICIFGLGLVILGILGMRHRKNDKEQ